MHIGGSPNATPSQERLHALDGLRAVMMLLGLVLHTLCSYTSVSLGAAWPYQDSATALPVDYGVTFIHTFRMPIFFVLAGFFAALLYVRRGPLQLLRNRWQRIAVPFMLFLVLVWPPVIMGFRFANAAKASVPEPADGVLSQFNSFVPGSTIHLWFLYYLILLYLLALAAAWLVRRLPAAFAKTAAGLFAALLQRPVARLVVPIVLTTLTLLPMQGRLTTSTAFTPNLAVLAAYGLFFGFGWLLYGQRHRLASLSSFPAVQVVAAVVVFVAVERYLPRAESAGSRALLHSAMGGAVVWLLFYGLTGLFMRYLQAPSALVRWVVDASYWVYLVHLPIVIWSVALLARTGWSVTAKILVVLSITTAVSFFSYWLFVRPSAVGQLLNGRRQLRGLQALPGEA